MGRFEVMTTFLLVCSAIYSVNSTPHDKRVTRLVTHPAVKLQGELVSTNQSESLNTSRTQGEDSSGVTRTHANTNKNDSSENINVSRINSKQSKYQRSRTGFQTKVIQNSKNSTNSGFTEVANQDIGTVIPIEATTQNKEISENIKRIILSTAAAPRIKSTPQNRSARRSNIEEMKEKIKGKIQNSSQLKNFKRSSEPYIGQTEKFFQNNQSVKGSSDNDSNISFPIVNTFQDEKENAEAKHGNFSTIRPKTLVTNSDVRSTNNEGKNLVLKRRILEASQMKKNKTNFDTNSKTLYAEKYNSSNSTVSGSITDMSVGSIVEKKSESSVSTSTPRMKFDRTTLSLATVKKTVRRILESSQSKYHRANSETVSKMTTEEALSSEVTKEPERESTTLLFNWSTTKENKASKDIQHTLSSTISPKLQIKTTNSPGRRTAVEGKAAKIKRKVNITVQDNATGSTNSTTNNTDAKLTNENSEHSEESYLELTLLFPDHNTGEGNEIKADAKHNDSSTTQKQENVSSTPNPSSLGSNTESKIVKPKRRISASNHSKIHKTKSELTSADISGEHFEATEDVPTTTEITTILSSDQTDQTKSMNIRNKNERTLSPAVPTTTPKLTGSETAIEKRNMKIKRPMKTDNKGRTTNTQLSAKHINNTSYTLFELPDAILKSEITRKGSRRSGRGTLTKANALNAPSSVINIDLSKHNTSEEVYSISVTKNKNNINNNISAETSIVNRSRSSSKRTNSTKRPLSHSLTTHKLLSEVRNIITLLPTAVTDDVTEVSTIHSEDYLTTVPDVTNVPQTTTDLSKNGNARRKSVKSAKVVKRTSINRTVSESDLKVKNITSSMEFNLTSGLQHFESKDNMYLTEFGGIILNLENTTIELNETDAIPSNLQNPKDDSATTLDLKNTTKLTSINNPSTENPQKGNVGSKRKGRVLKMIKITPMETHTTTASGDAVETSAHTTRVRSQHSENSTISPATLTSENNVRRSQRRIKSNRTTGSKDNSDAIAKLSTVLKLDGNVAQRHNEGNIYDNGETRGVPVVVKIIRRFGKVDSNTSSEDLSLKNYENSEEVSNLTKILQKTHKTTTNISNSNQDIISETANLSEINDAITNSQPNPLDLLTTSLVEGTTAVSSHQTTTTNELVEATTIYIVIPEDNSSQQFPNRRQRKEKSLRTKNDKIVSVDGESLVANTRKGDLLEAEITKPIAAEHRDKEASIEVEYIGSDSRNIELVIPPDAEISHEQLHKRAVDDSSYKRPIKTNGVIDPTRSQLFVAGSSSPRSIQRTRNQVFYRRQLPESQRSGSKYKRKYIGSKDLAINNFNITSEGDILTTNTETNITAIQENRQISETFLTTLIPKVDNRVTSQPSSAFTENTSTSTYDRKPNQSNESLLDSIISTIEKSLSPLTENPKNGNNSKFFRPIKQLDTSTIPTREESASPLTKLSEDGNFARYGYPITHLGTQNVFTNQKSSRSLDEKPGKEVVSAYSYSGKNIEAINESARNRLEVPNVPTKQSEPAIIKSVIPLAVNREVKDLVIEHSTSSLPVTTKIKFYPSIKTEVSTTAKTTYSSSKEYKTYTRFPSQHKTYSYSKQPGNRDFDHKLDEESYYKQEKSSTKEKEFSNGEDDTQSFSQALASRAYKLFAAVQQLAGAVFQLPKQFLQLPVRLGLYPASQRVQREISHKVEFPCKPEYEYSTVPTSVHKLRPQNIKVIASLGDSLTAANGDLDNNEERTLNYRGVSAVSGGKGTWRKYLTLPNILKEFNPNVVGYELGTSDAPVSGLKVAENGALDDHILQQTQLLVTKIRNDRSIDFENDWKLVNIMVGSSDICSEYCYQYNDKDSPAEHLNQLGEALLYLKKNLPRTFVNLMHTPNVLRLEKMNNVPYTCRLKQQLMCPCLFESLGKAKSVTVLEMLKGYWEAERRAAEDVRFETDDFSVVLQPFFIGMEYPKMINTLLGEVPDLGYFASDCFHFSQKGNAQVANALWNNMLEPVGSKTNGWAPTMKTFKCPSENTPYIFTRRNSKTFFQTGHQ